jgi:uncharacterized membrane protein HdeD (DUF308 family)
VSQQPVVYTTEKRRFPWWTLLVTGVLVAAVGVGFLVWPFFAATWMLVVLFGSALIANGLAVLTRSAASPAALIGGIVLILTVGAIVAFVGVGLVVFGVLWIAIGARFAGRGPAILVPGVLILVGGVVALAWPGLALAVVAAIGGVCLVLLGALIIWTANRLRRLDVSATTIVM